MFVTLTNLNKDRRPKFRRSIFFGLAVARFSFSCDFTFPKSHSLVPSCEGEGETPVMMRPNISSLYSPSAAVRRSSLNALLFSLVVHSAVIFAIFLTGMTFRPVSADLSPLVVTITSFSEGNQTDVREAPTGIKEKIKNKDLTKTNRSDETKASPSSAEKISPPTDPIPQKTDISQSSAMEIHDLNVRSVRINGA